MKTAVVAAIVYACASSLAHAASTTPIDLSSLVNTDITAYTGGNDYPQNGGALTVAGVNFSLAVSGPQSHTSIIQTSGTQTYSIPVNRTGVTVAYTLINSSWGICGTNVGEVDFVGTHTTYTYTLTESTNIRDHYNGLYCNTVSAVAGSALFVNDRLDMQQINLPGGFASDTLLRIDLKSNGAGLGGQPFLAAIVADGVPVPPATAPVLRGGLLAMLGAILTAVAWLALRRRKSADYR